MPKLSKMSKSAKNRLKLFECSHTKKPRCLESDQRFVLLKTLYCNFQEDEKTKWSCENA